MQHLSLRWKFANADCRTKMKIFQLSTLKVFKGILIFINAVFHVLERDRGQLKHLSGSHHITFRLKSPVALFCLWTGAQKVCQEC